MVQDGSEFINSHNKKEQGKPMQFLKVKVVLAAIAVLFVSVSAQAGVDRRGCSTDDLTTACVVKSFNKLYKQDASAVLAYVDSVTRSGCNDASAFASELSLLRVGANVPSYQDKVARLTEKTLKSDTACMLDAMKQASRRDRNLAINKLKNPTVYKKRTLMKRLAKYGKKDNYSAIVKSITD